MSHFGVISPPVSGHLNPMAALGRELQHRGHRVTFLQMEDVRAKVLSEGLEFITLGQSDLPPGSLAASTTRIGQLSGLAALQFTIDAIRKTTQMFCRDAPQAIADAGIEALIVDQTEPAGAAIADYLGLPYVTVCCALHIDREPAVPPIFTDWTYNPAAWAQLRNRLGYAIFDRLTRPVRAVIDDYRRQWQLPAYRTADASFSKLACISQQPAAFEFPRTALPDCFHYVGPLRNASPQAVSFPYERLTGAPLIYASLGTLQNTKADVFGTIAAACEGLEAQLVLSHGGGLSDREVEQLPGEPLVVPYAPQTELLAKASLTVSHAGLNTVLDSLTHGVPIVAIPITYEQPAIAARMRWVGAGEIVALKQLTVATLRAAIQRVMDDPNYSAKAQVVAASIRQSGGVRRAADLTEAIVA